MSGDVTYQALERLTYLSNRDALKNGLVIAGQPYYDIYFTGGNIIGVTLTDCIINGETTVPNLEVFTGPGDITGTPADYYVIVNKTVGQATTYFMQPTPSENQRVEPLVASFSPAPNVQNPNECIPVCDFVDRLMSPTGTPATSNGVRA